MTGAGNQKHYDCQALRTLFGKERIATIDQLKEVLGTDVDMTVFRKLKGLSYYTSYSHRGRYYTLDEIARFDELGLWSFRSVWFSRYRTLLRTAEFLVETSEAGFFATELEHLLHVVVKDALRTLVKRNRLHRQRIGGHWLYCALDGHKRRQQVLTRQILEERGMAKLPTYTDTAEDDLKAAIIIFFSLLNEKQQRLYAGLESFKRGHSGDCKMASLLGLDPQDRGTGPKRASQWRNRPGEGAQIRSRPQAGKKSSTGNRPHPGAA